jgi:hypothetical protein
MLAGWRGRDDSSENCLREKSNFACRFKLICAVPPSRKNIYISYFRKLWLSLPVPRRAEGRIAIVTNVGRNAVDVDVP